MERNPLAHSGGGISILLIDILRLVIEIPRITPIGNTNIPAIHPDNHIDNGIESRGMNTSVFLIPRLRVNFLVTI